MIDGVRAVVVVVVVDDDDDVVVDKLVLGELVLDELPEPSE